MRHHFTRKQRFSTHRMLIWVVLLALASYGLTGVLQEYAAARHTHRVVKTSFQALPGWVDFRRVGHAAAAAPVDHGSGLFETHHHALADPTVLSLDSMDEGLSADAAAVLTSAGGHAGAGFTGSLFSAADGGVVAWLAHAPHRFRSADLRLLERPPKG